MKAFVFEYKVPGCYRIPGTRVEADTLDAVLEQAKLVAPGEWKGVEVYEDERLENRRPILGFEVSPEGDVEQVYPAPAGQTQPSHLDEPIDYDGQCPF